MNEVEFEANVQAAFEALPETYREACKGIAIQAPSLPSTETLNALGLSDPLELLGLYHGISLTRKSLYDLPTQPDVVLIYRLPILAYAHARGLPVQEVIQHVLVHEIGHHFGFSDSEMEEIESRGDKA